jgi:hypothetical protein
MFPGYVWCNCDPSSIAYSYGTGRLPDGSFDVSPQGVAHLAVAGDLEHLVGQL